MVEQASPLLGGGQDGVRVKILQNGTDVVDVSSLSPDHVVTADTLLASRVELVRGASTLLYGTASQAGVVNVIDERIPTQMPQDILKDNVEGETLLRYNTSGNEKVATANLAMGLTDNVAVRVEGLTRKSDDYDVPEFKSDIMLDYLPDSLGNGVVGFFLPIIACQRPIHITKDCLLQWSCILVVSIWQPTLLNMATKT